MAVKHVHEFCVGSLLARNDLLALLVFVVCVCWEASNGRVFLRMSAIHKTNNTNKCKPWVPRNQYTKPRTSINTNKPRTQTNNTSKYEETKKYRQRLWYLRATQSITRVCEQTLFLGKPLPWSPAAETALQPKVSHLLWILYLLEYL